MQEEENNTNNEVVENTEEETQEPETTLDEETSNEAPQVDGAGESTSTPENAPDGEYLSVVNSTGEFKYVLSADEARVNAENGGFSVREPSEEELAEYKREQGITD